jgi:hypothetical protein
MKDTVEIASVKLNLEAVSAYTTNCLSLFLTCQINLSYTLTRTPNGG